MLLASVVETSQRITGTTKRLEKTALLAGLLKQLTPEEIEVVVAWLSGRTRQGKTGIGYGTLRGASGAPAGAASLEVLGIDRTLSEIASVRGAGSGEARQQLLRTVFSSATEPEQRFLFGLLTGELRQGALEGLMVDAIARAAGIALERVRRAVMMAGDAALVARDALARGEAGL